MKEIQYFFEGNGIIVALLPIIVTIINVVVIKERVKIVSWQLFCLFYISSYSWFYWDKLWIIYVNIISLALSVIIIIYKCIIDKKNGDQIK